MQPSDEALVRQSQQGEVCAFGVLYERHAAGLLGYLVALLTRRGATAGRAWQEAEDLVQDAFRLAWRQIASLREPARFAAWLRTIARNRAAERPSGLILVAEIAEIPNDDDRPADELSRQEKGDRILAAIKRLKDPYRDIVYARYFRDPQPTFEQLAAELDKPAGTLRANATRALRELRRILGDDFLSD